MIFNPLHLLSSNPDFELQNIKQSLFMIFFAKNKYLAAVFIYINK